MLARRFGLFLAGAALVAFASAASASSTTTWTDMADELDGRSLTFHGHNLHRINYAWATAAHHDWDFADISDKVWEMDVTICTKSGDCGTKHAKIWIKSGSESRFHGFYKVDGQRWRRARPVPEPTSAAVFALGLGVVATRLRRK